MAAFSFRTKLLLIFTVLLSLTLGAASYFVVTGANQNSKNAAKQKLDVSRAVLQKLLHQRDATLRERVLILANNVALKDAIATNEHDAISSLLSNDGDRVDADLVILLSPNGEWLFTSHKDIWGKTNIEGLLRSQNQGFSFIIPPDGQPYQFVLSPARASGDIIAWVGMGLALDQHLTDDIKHITGTDVTLIYQSRLYRNHSIPAGHRQAGLLSSFDFSRFSDNLKPAGNAAPADNDAQYTPDNYVQQYLQQIETQFAGIGYLTAVHTLVDNDHGKLVVLLSTSMQQGFAAYGNLKLQFLAIFIVALLIAMAATYFIARSVTQPIESLVTAAMRIARGDYRQTIRVPGKNEIGLLGQTLNIMQGAINQREEHITYQAQHDLLTNLPNREFSREVIKALLEQELSDKKYALCILQVSNLNQLSDVYGTDVKDELLALTAQRLRNCVDKYDLVARISSNEFLLFFHAFEREAVNSTCQKMFSAMDSTCQCGGIDIRAISKMGISYCPEHGDSFDDLLRRAYIALSHCHRSTSRFAVYQSGQDASHLRKINITSRLQNAIKNDGFELVFQPQFDLRSSCVKQCEVLIRWNDEELGDISPEEFIPLAEHSGDIVHITRLVFDHCIRLLQTWQKNGVSLGVCINLSPRDILSSHFVEYVLTTISKAEIKTHLLVLEITETAMIESPAKAIANLQKFYDAGLRLAMDDFGTGFSSLSQLKSIPLHELKIDKSFITRLDQDTDDQKIVKSTIEMAHDLNLAVVAEGVESKAAFDLLQRMGCDIVQGHFLTVALPCEQLQSWLQSSQCGSLTAAS